MGISFRGLSAAFCLLAFSAFPLHSQAPQSALAPARTVSDQPIPSRIGPAADWSTRVPLPNHHPLWATPGNSTGPGSSEITATLVLARSPQQQAALDQLLADQKNPASPEFHHWLTPAEFGQRFGLSDSDLQSITQWLQSQGLRVNFVAPGRTFINFTGPASALGSAFGTEIRTYSVNGESRVSVASEPTIPAAIAPVLKSVHGLYTIDDRPQHFITEPQTAGPALTLSNGSNFVTPGDFGEIYDWYAPTASGYRQTIGIVGRSRTDIDDFSQFRSIAYSWFQTPTEIVPTAFGGIDPGPPYKTTAPSGANIGEQAEATLDVTRAGSVAPNASILLVVATAASGGIEADAQYLIQTSPVPAQIINISYGACEANAGQSGVQLWDTLFEQAAAEGISVFVASGDSGAAGCEQAFTTPLVTPPAISPNYICSSSYATCVGGTQFNDTADPSQYWSTSNGTNLSSAQKYIPEGGWNQPTTSKGASQVAGSGGGVSAFIPTPKWQTGPGVPSERAGRYTPDLSFTGSCHDPYFMCLTAAGASCVADSSGSFTFLGMCGTSASAPSMAGVAAVLDEKMKFAQGSINPQIYALAANKPATFHDTTPASSGVTTCDVHTPSPCNNSTPGPTGLTGGQAGYPLTTGYDMVTGVGSPDIAVFFNNFATALPQPALTITPSAKTITPADDLTLTVKLDPGSGQPVPTGIVKLSSWNYPEQQATVVNGAATFDAPAYSLAWSVDVDTFAARYIPDSASAAVYSPAEGSVSVAIQDLPITIAFNAPATVSTADDVHVTVSVSGPKDAPTPTGSVYISTFGTPIFATPRTDLTAGSVTLTLPAGVLPAGSPSITAYYQPDAPGGRLYNKNFANTTINVTQGPKTTPTINATLSASSISPVDQLAIGVKIIPASGAPTATGYIAVIADNLTYSAVLTSGAASVYISPMALPVGVDTITISYPGDPNNNPASTSATVTVNKFPPALRISTPSTIITADQPLNLQIGFSNFTSYGVPSGTVSVSGAGYTSNPATIVNGQATLSIPAGSLPIGSDSLTVTYSGDSFYASVTQPLSITVNPAPSPSFSLSATNVTINTPGATTSNISIVTVTPAAGFTGSVALAATITSSPSGAQNLPTLSFGSTSPVSITSASSANATLTVNTTPTTTSQAVPPPFPHHTYLAGETALGLVVLFWIPKRRRGLRTWLSVLMILGISVTLSACGGGGSASTPTPTPVTHAGTTPGTYVVTISATSGSLSSTTTLTVVVQ